MNLSVKVKRARAFDGRTSTDLVSWPFPITSIDVSDLVVTIYFSKTIAAVTPQSDLLLGLDVKVNGRTLKLGSVALGGSGATLVRYVLDFSTPNVPVTVRAQDPVLVSYDDTVGVIAFTDFTALDSFADVTPVNLAVLDTPTINDSVIIDPDFIAPWLQLASPAALDRNKIVIVANSDPANAATVEPGYTSNPWPLGMAKYYCDKRGIPQSNIVAFDMGTNPEIWASGFPAPDWWRDTFCTDIKTKMDAIGAQAVLCAPGVPWITLSPAIAGDTVLRKGSVVEMAGMARHVLADSASRSCVGSLEFSGSFGWLWWDGAAPALTIIGTPQKNVGYKINGVSDTTLGRPLVVGNNVWTDQGRIQEKAVTDLLGTVTNMMVPTGRVGLTSRRADLSGSSSAHPDGYTDETEAIAVAIINKATAAMNMAGLFAASRSEQILFHIHDAFGTGGVQEFSLAVMYASIIQWGLSGKYYFRKVDASTITPELEVYASKAGADYFVNPANLGAGVFTDDGTYLNLLQNEKVATQIGEVVNADQYNAPWVETWDAPASAYCGAVLTLGLSLGFNYGTAHERKGGFSWMTQTTHKAGGFDSEAQIGQLVNLLRGMTMCEASYYLAGDSGRFEKPCGDPLWSPYPIS